MELNNKEYFTGIINNVNGEWFVTYGDHKKIPLHPESVKEINELSLVFDNIESRISSQPQVNFEIISVVQNSNYVETIMGVTKPFDVINYAKLINKTTKTNNMSNRKNEILQLIEEFKGTQLPHKQNPYHPDSDTCSGLVQFEKWLNLKL